VWTTRSTANTWLHVAYPPNSNGQTQ